MIFAFFWSSYLVVYVSFQSIRSESFPELPITKCGLPDNAKILPRGWLNTDFKFATRIAISSNCIMILFSFCFWFGLKFECCFLNVFNQSIRKFVTMMSIITPIPLSSTYSFSEFELYPNSRKTWHRNWFCIFLILDSSNLLFFLFNRNCYDGQSISKFVLRKKIRYP